MDQNTGADRARTALVLGGGGMAGIAWEAGVLSSLIAAGADLRSADLVVGTSAGSMVGALLRLDALDRLRELAVAGADGVGYAEPATPDAGSVEERFAAAVAEAGSPQDARARVGQAARQVVGGQSDDDRASMFAGVLGADAWPEGPLAVTAVDAEDGSFRVFRREDGVPLPRALAASCSVPFVWTPVRIDGRDHVDGGVRSGTNADVADGFGKVLVLATWQELPSPTGPCLDDAVAGLRVGGSEVETIIADEASAAAFGDDTLALSSVEPSMAAGIAQGAAIAEHVLAFWR